MTFAFHIFMTNQKTGLGKFVMLWLLLVNCPASFYYHGTCCYPVAAAQAWTNENFSKKTEMMIIN